MIFIITITLYFFFYLKIEKITEKNLFILKNELDQKNISFTWESINKSGFPYRIVNNLNNVKIKINSSELYIKNFSIIYQPWNLNHIFLKTSDQINIINKNNNIIILPEFLASIVVDKNNEKRISINFNKISITNDNYIHNIKRPEIYFRESLNDNLQYSLKIEEIQYSPTFMNDNSIRNLLINGKIINHKNINFNNFHKWLSNEGGIDIEYFKFNTINIPMKGNAFLGIDENLDIQSSISIESEKFDDLALFLRNKNLVSEKLFKSSIIIIKAIELAAKTSNKTPKYSISIQDGYLSFMGIKLLNVPRFDRLNFN